MRLLIFEVIKMNLRIIAPKAGIAIGVLALAAMVGCTGNTGGGDESADSFAQDQFVAGDATTGSISLTVSEGTLSVGETTDFVTRVVDSAGGPVEGLRLSCDSEQGIAIVEPTTGSTITNASGAISGVIGCAAPGSYRFGCRMPIGAAKRKLVSIRCEGPIPVDFDGFPGAAGGGLGSGSGGFFDGDDDLNSGTAVVINSLALLDQGLDGSSSASVDIQNLGPTGCPTDTEDVFQPEPFFDTYAQISITNNTVYGLTFSNARFKIRDSSNAVILELGPQGFLGTSIVAPNGAQTALLTVFAPVAQKTTTLAALNLTQIYTYEAILTGTNDIGDSVTVTARSIVSFGQIDRCPEVQTIIDVNNGN